MFWKSLFDSVFLVSLLFFWVLLLFSCYLLTVIIWLPLQHCRSGRSDSLFFRPNLVIHPPACLGPHQFSTCIQRTPLTFLSSLLSIIYQVFESSFWFMYAALKRRKTAITCLRHSSGRNPIENCYRVISRFSSTHPDLVPFVYLLIWLRLSTCHRDWKRRISTVDFIAWPPKALVTRFWPFRSAFCSASDVIYGRFSVHSAVFSSLQIQFSTSFIVHQPVKGASSVAKLRQCPANAPLDNKVRWAGGLLSDAGM